MDGVCAVCGGVTEYDSDAVSDICISCGTLVDSTQAILTHDISYEANKDLYERSRPVSATLKSVRSSAGNWDLAGQGKEARDRRNITAIHAFIRSLTTTFTAGGLSHRAMNLFDQAHSRGLVRWGSKARAIAAGCISITFRENLRPDSLEDLACIIESSPQRVSRARSAVISALGIQLPRTDPFSLVSEVENSLTTALQQPDTALYLQPLVGLHIREAARTCRSLMELLARFSVPVSELPAKATACAAFIVSLEAEGRKQLPKLKDLCGFFGNVGGASNSIVQKRYETVEDELSGLLQGLPWLDQREFRKNGRGKVAKRLAVARGLKDILLWQEDVWKKRLTQQEKLILEAENDGHDNPSDTESFTTSGTGGTDVSSRTSLKKRKRTNVLSDAAQFLLNPLSVSLPSAHTKSDIGFQVQAYLLPARLPPNSYLGVSSYLLSSDGLESLNNKTPPTRLQLLAAARGGSGESEVPDEDLFEDGEWEAIQRPPEEVENLRLVWGFDELSAAQALADCDSPRKKRKTEPGKEQRQEVSSRINLDALAAFIGNEDNKDEDDGGMAFDFLGAMSMDDYNFDTRWDDEKASDDEGGGEELSTAQIGSFDDKIPFDDEGVVIVGCRTPSPVPTG